MVQSSRIFFERWARGFLVAAMLAAIIGLLFQMSVFYIVAVISLLLSFVVFAKARKYPEER
ncbi:MAG: hypothetical protein E7Z72_05590 [Methanocorpusculum parvum]|nr:hypothetical protein [Methanocorpusculum parvum]